MWVVLGMLLKLQVTRRDVLLAAFCAVVVWMGGTVVYRLHPEVGLIFALGLITGILVLFSVSCVRRLQRTIANLHDQTEAFIAVTQTLKLDTPLPSLTSWAITPDVAKLLIELILERQPKVIVECGAGASTIVQARMLQLQGAGKVWSIESFPDSLDFVRRQVERHGLSDFVELIHAPLMEQEIDGRPCTWYDRKRIPEIQDIDLLFIDGPPQYGMPKGSLMRYPALPVFLKGMKKGAIAVVDDGARHNEREIVRRWVEKFGVEATFYDSYIKGVWIVRI